MTRAYNTATTQQNSGGAVSPFIAGKNKIINGGFDIWQRGTSFTPTAASVYFTADRFYTVVPAATSVTRQTFTPGTAPVAGYEGQFYMNTTITANAQNYEAGQRIENARTFAGETVTLSFWARSTVGAQALNVGLTQYFGSGGSPSAAASATLITGTLPYTPTSSWQRFTFTFTVPSVAGKTFGTNNDSFLYVKIFQYTATTTNTSLDIWGVQLEAGSVATAFQTGTGSIQGELAACKRYYERIGNAGLATHQYANGNLYSSDLALFVIPYEVQKRAQPSLSSTAYTTFGMDGTSPLSIAFQDTDTQTMLVRIGVSGATQGFATRLYGINATTNYIEVSAEL